MPPQKEMIEITCRVLSIPISRPSNFNEGKNWVLISTDQGKLSGEIEPGSVLTQCDYRVSGYWEETPHGKTFKFRALSIREPQTRNGVVQYLNRYAPWVGAVIAGRLCDKFGVDQAISKLRSDPDGVASCGLGLNIERCRKAAEELAKLQKFEETRVKLLDIFSGRGFRHALPDICIERWGSAAADVVKANPFILLESKLPGCGFSIVDQLYMALGHDPAAMIRQVYGLVFVLENLPDNSTWGRRSDVYTQLGKLMSKGFQMAECIAESVRLNKIRTRVEPPNNELWIACRDMADQESMIAERLWEIGGAGLLRDAEQVESESIDDLLSEPLSIQITVTEDDLLADSAVARDPLPRATVAIGKSKPDIRDVVQPIPKAHRKTDQDDDLCFELDASDSNGVESYEEAAKLIEELDSLLEELQDIDAAIDFFESVSERMSGISENIERKHSATEKQIQALKNMISGTETWLENRRD